MMTRIGSGARIEGDVPQSEKVVGKMGGGIRMFISNHRQAALAGSSAGDRIKPGTLSSWEPAGVRGGGRPATCEKALSDFRRWWAAC